MLYECGCGKTINIATSHFCYISDEEIKRLCNFEGSISSPSPWMDSALDDEGDIVQKTYKPVNDYKEKPTGIPTIDDIDYEEDEDEEDLTPDISWNVVDDE
jgi:hypothetical protein